MSIVTDFMRIDRQNWIEFQLAIGKFPQGVTLVEYVRRVPKGPK